MIMIFPDRTDSANEKTGTGMPASVESAPGRRTGSSSMDASRFSRYLLGGFANIAQHRQTLDAINVFPVPDGDTGRNLTITTSGIAAALRAEEQWEFEGLYRLIAREALESARGNSGMIFSQFLKGLLRPMTFAESIDAEVWHRAWGSARDCAYAGVSRPRSGTILSLLDRAAEEHEPGLASEELSALVEICGTCLLDTPSKLPELKRAGVVDAGGLALVLFLEGGLLSLVGNGIPGLSPWMERNLPPEKRKVLPGGISEEVPEHRFCLEMLLEGPEPLVDDLMLRLKYMGNSIETLWDDSRVRIHMHTNEPYAVRETIHADIKVWRMQLEDMAPRVRGRNAEEGRPPDNLPAVCALVRGKGFVGVLESLEIDYVIDLETNPMPGETLRRQLHDSGRGKALVLVPGDDGCDSLEKETSIAKGDWEVWNAWSEAAVVAACVAFTPWETEELNRVRMAEALRRLRYGMVLDEADGFCFRVGVGEEVSKLYPAVGDAAAALVAALIDPQDRLITIYTGVRPILAQVEEVRSSLSLRFPGVETEVVYGGQARGMFQISVE